MFLLQGLRARFDDPLEKLLSQKFGLSDGLSFNGKTIGLKTFEKKY